MHIARLSRPFLALRKNDPARSALLAFRCLAAITVGVGIYGQFIDSIATTPPVGWMNVHALFGAAVYCTVTARLVSEKCGRSQAPVVVYDVSRHLSRLVYLLLYGLAGVAIAMTVLPHVLYGMAPPPWRSIGIDRDAIGSGLAFPQSFQPYIAHGIAALFLIRIEAHALFHHSADF